MDELEQRRKTFALVLGTLVALRKPLIYIDETSFRAQAPPLPRSWSLRDKHNKHSVATLGWSVTVYGAIGDCLTHPVFYYANSTN